MTDHADEPPGWNEAHARDYAEKYGDWPTNAAVAKLARLRSAQLVLDVGMGTGTALHAAIAEAPVVAIGIDPTAAMVEVAHAKAAAAGLAGRLVFRQAPAEAIPWGDGMFDVVWAINSLPHWEVAKQGCAEVFRVTKPGGTFWLADEDVMGTGSHPQLDNAKKLLEGAGFVDIEREEHQVGSEAGPILLTTLKCKKPRS